MEEIKNVYDNEEFFNSYAQLRKNENSHNTVIEQPTMRALLPDVKGMRVLELGCGSGANAFAFAEGGAVQVLAIDLSEKMLSVAKEENSHPCVQYLQMDMAQIGELEGKFDLVYSSLAFHYVEDFGKLMKQISGLLNDGGVLLFSQEHPLTTATIDGLGHFNKDENDEYISYTLSNYCQSGKRVVNWFVDGVLKYHRTFSDIITAVLEAGLVVERVCEPVPPPCAIEKVPRMKKELIKPSFLIVKAKKS